MHNDVYTLSWVKQEAREVFTREVTRIEIRGDEQNPSVELIDTKGGTHSGENVRVEAEQNLVFNIPGEAFGDAGTEHRCVVSQWHDQQSSKTSGEETWILYGEVFEGDPDGTGGFGGQGSGSGGTGG